MLFSMAASSYVFPRAAITQTIADSPEVRAAVAAFEQYNQALIDKQYARVRDRFIHVPFVVVDEKPLVIASVDAVVEGLRNTRESMDSAGYSSTRLSSPRVSMLRRDRLLLNYRLSHLRKDASVITERANF
jgi:hypothetical protein